MEKPWNTECVACDNKYAYKGFTECECPNKNCKHYSTKQEVLVQDYLDELTKLTTKENNTCNSYNCMDNDGFYKSNNSTSDEQITNVYGYGYCYDDQYQNDTDEIKELFGLM